MRLSVNKKVILLQVE